MSTYDGPPGQFPQPGQQQPTAYGQPAPAGSSGKGRKVALVGGLAAGAVVLGGGAIAATMFFSQGSQPAEVLPSTTVAYASIDLDPSGGQKIEVLKTLRKFPAFTDATDIDEDADLMEAFFDEAVANGECEGLDYASDVKPWLGQRAAVAAVKGEGDEPDPVFVLQVTDGGKAESGIEGLVETCGGDASEFGTALTGDWAVFAETQEIADGVVEDGGKESLASDADYQRWTDEAGGEAIVTTYVSRHVADYADEILASAPSASAPVTPFGDELGTEPDPTGSDEAAVEQVRAMLEGFEGAALAVRFDDGGLELEAAGGFPQDKVAQFSPEGADLVESLPADTIAALGFGYEEGWLDALDEQLASSGTDMDLDSVLGEVGLTREDVEKGVGEAMALAVGSGVDVDAISNGGPEDVPAGVVLKADPDDVNNLIGKVDETYQEQAGSSLLDGAPWLRAEGDDVAVISPHDEFRSSLLSPEGSLGDTSEYDSVVDDDAEGVVFVNFDADDDWLVRAASDAGQDVTDNLEPLSALALSWWGDDDAVHVKLRLTTN